MVLAYLIIFLLLIIIIILSILLLSNYISYDFQYNIYSNKSILSRYLKPRIVVSLTTTPKRIIYIKETIDSIMNQTIKPDIIVLNLPKIFKRDNSVFTKIPDFILQNKSIIINFCEDLGPATKIVPTCISNITNDSDIIFSIDDDVYYPDKLFELYLYYHSLCPNSIITGTSLFTINNSRFHELKECELLEGFSCVLYKKRFLKNIPIKLFDKNKVPIYHYLSDDLILSNYLIKNNIKIYTFTNTHPIIKHIKSLDYGFNNDALHKGADGTASACNIFEHCNFKNYKETIKYLKQNNNYYLKHFDENNLYSI